MPELHDARIVALLMDALALLVGIALGSFFYGGLWWTVRRLATWRHPALVVGGSMLLRTSVALGGLYVAGRDDWRRLLACLLGCVLARVAVTWITRRRESACVAPGTGLRHAP
jgi:F1F0 ATPase subunit 2